MYYTEALQTCYIRHHSHYGGHWVSALRALGS